MNAVAPGPGQNAEPMQVLLEVNVADEGTKFGVAVGAAQHLAEQIDTMDDIHMVGLMGMAPFSGNPEAARPTFAPPPRDFLRKSNFAK